MLPYLITLFIYALGLSVDFAGAPAHASSNPLPEEELRALASSPQWRELLYYEENFKGEWQSRVAESSFFLSPEGRKDPLKELKAAVAAFQDIRPVKQILGAGSDFSAQCTFPARYQLVKKSFPLPFRDEPCPELLEWIDQIGATQVRLVFSGAYLNNPASLFGHSFLILARQGDQGENLLDYSVGFLAATDESDNAFVYTLKGLSGGYYGHFQITPYYTNVGLYNNGEGRDLWEYPLPLSPEEIRFLLLHLWEVQGKGLPYFFFNRNCAYYLQELLEAVKSEWSLTNRYAPFVFPLEIIKDVNLVHGPLPRPFYRASLEKRIIGQISSLSPQQEVILRRGEGRPESIEDKQVLDTLIDMWKWRNFRKKATLDPQDSQLMHRTMWQRSRLRPENNRESNPVPSREGLVRGNSAAASEWPNPILGHDPRTLVLGVLYRDRDSSKQPGLSNWAYRLSFTLGYHSLQDRSENHENFAYIDFLGGQVSFERQRGPDEGTSLTLDSLNLVRIYALNDFNFHLPRFSWNLDIGYKRRGIRTHEKNMNFKGGLGLTQRWRSRLLVYGMLNAHLEKERVSLSSGRSNLGMELGWRLDFSPAWALVGQLQGHFLSARPPVLANLSLHYYLTEESVLYWQLERDWNVKMNSGEGARYGLYGKVQF